MNPDLYYRVTERFTFFSVLSLKCRVMKRFIFFFSKNVYLLEAPYFSILVTLRALGCQSFQPLRLHEIRLHTRVFESPSSSSLCHEGNLKISESLSGQTENN